MQNSEITGTKPIKATHKLNLKSKGACNWRGLVWKVGETAKPDQPRNVQAFIFLGSQDQDVRGMSAKDKHTSIHFKVSGRKSGHTDTKAIQCKKLKKSWYFDNSSEFNLNSMQRESETKWNSSLVLLSPTIPTQLWKIAPRRAANNWKQRAASIYVSQMWEPSQNSVRAFEIWEQSEEYVCALEVAKHCENSKVFFRSENSRKHWIVFSRSENKVRNRYVFADNTKRWLSKIQNSAKEGC